MSLSVFRSGFTGIPAICLTGAFLGGACLVPVTAVAQSPYTQVQERQFHRDATAALAHGAYDDARALASTRDTDDPSATALLAQLEILRGEYEAAENRLRPVASANPISAASLELALLHDYLGRADEAMPRLEMLLDRLQRSREPLDMYRAARAARALGEHRLANSLIRDASLAEPDDPALHTLWGQLFGDKYDQLEASGSFADALRLDDRWAPAHLGLARAMADTDPPAARSAAATAIELAPRDVGAHLFLAQRRQKLRRPLEVRLRVRLALGKKTIRASNPLLIIAIDHISVATVLGKGTPFAAQEGDEAAGFIKVLGLAPHFLPHVQGDVVVVALMGGELQGGDIAAMGVVGGD